MGTGKFEKPLVVTTPRGGTKVIYTASQAAEYLGAEWPIDGHNARAARDMCFAVLNDLLHPKVAHRAFENALREADRLVEC